MCVICLSTGIAIISKQPSQFPQWNSSIVDAGAANNSSTQQRRGDDHDRGPAALLHTQSHIT